MAEALRRTLLFLDFDGVTHPLHGGGNSPYHTRSHRLEEALRDPAYFCPENVTEVNRLATAIDADIVVTSAWRLDFDWTGFNHLFEDRVIGQTPWIDMYERGREHLRYREVLEFIASRKLARRPWLALDDNRHLYPPYAPAFITDGSKGLTATDVDSLLASGARAEA